MVFFLLQNPNLFFNSKNSNTPGFDKNQNIFDGSLNSLVATRVSPTSDLGDETDVSHHAVTAGGRDACKRR